MSRLNLNQVLVLGLIAAATSGVSSAEASFPLTSTLPKEQKIILLCSVDDAMMAKNCSPQPGRPSSNIDKRTKAFIQVETLTPDYLAGATPGNQVLVMIRRSTAAPLDNANPGRALAVNAPSQQAITSPDWALMPNPRDIDGYFPEKALRMSTSGSATVRCTVGAMGDLLGCWVMDESTSGFGFASAALDLTTFVRMKPTTEDGASTLGRAYSIHAEFDARSDKITFSSGR